MYFSVCCTVFLVFIELALSLPEVSDGGLCMPSMYYHAHEEDPRLYYKCLKDAHNDNIGNWKLEECAEDTVFAMINQTCVEKSNINVRRQQSLCNLNSIACGSPVTCPGATGAANVGSNCYWLQSPLQNDMNSVGYFYQCTPQSIGTQCGQWQRMVCPIGTQFNAQLQVCVAAAVQGTCPINNQVAVSPCGPQYQCPNTCQCQVQTCCTQQPTPAPQIPNCSDGRRAISTCNANTQCPVGYQCQNSGCCLIATCVDGSASGGTCTAGSNQCPSNFQCQNGVCCQSPLPTCPDNSQALSRCTGATCPTGYDCINGGCCPLPRCSNTQTSTQRCSGAGQSTCPRGFFCENGGCCPLPTCPNGQPAIQVCGSGGTCPTNYNCQNGACCTTPLPSCPNRGTASQRCTGTGQGTCPTGTYCSNGGCCPLPNCVNGQIAIAVCTPGGTCPNNYACTNGACCPLPTCPRGQVASQLCSGANSCRSGQYCWNNQACCVIPSCPSGNIAVSACGVGAPSPTCARNFQCVNGGCCPLPTCPLGQIASQTCTGANSCPAGQYCWNNQACCVIPSCPSGSRAATACGVGAPSRTCARNFQCINGGCCPLPTCPLGQIASQTCTGANSCPAGQYCWNNQACCVLPSCPSGGRAVSACGVGAPSTTCARNFQCVNGGCCPLPRCPQGQTATQTCTGPSSCPANQYCWNSQACCPVPSCPSGNLAVSPCGTAAPGQTCPTNYQCTNGGCCPIPLPTCLNGVAATLTCTGPGQCGTNTGQYCYTDPRGIRGCCSVPTCADGSLAARSCTGTGQGSCNTNFQCIQGGCCPLPVPNCPISNQQAIQPCAANSNCPNNYYCFTGANNRLGCCPLPRCTDGAIAQSACQGSGQSTCATGYACVGGGCCQRSCPNGARPSQVCGNSGQCPVNFNCQNGVCCQTAMPTCAGGVQAIQRCTGTGVVANCPSGYSCQGGGCCRLASCVNGQPGIQPCNAGSCPPGTLCYNNQVCCTATCSNGNVASAFCTSNSCPTNQVCLNNLCCPRPLPTCNTGVVASQFCTANSNCPTDYQCQNGGCCPVQRQLPLCTSTGQLAIQRCAATQPCPANYECLNGGCCPQPVVQPRCPQPVCMCAIINNVCPYGTNCQQGTCCAAQNSVYMTTYTPGSQCGQATQCNGFPTNAGCMNGYCSCINGARSDGARCTMRRMKYNPKLKCGPFNKPCNFETGASSPNIKRKQNELLQFDNPRLAMEALGISNETEPEFWVPLPSANHCQTLQDCTPDKVCVENRCLDIILPGEKGCQSNAQCVNNCNDDVDVDLPESNGSKSCPSAFCMLDGVHNGKHYSECMCEPGSYVHNLTCVAECPEGMVSLEGLCSDESSLSTIRRKKRALA